MKQIECFGVMSPFRKEWSDCAVCAWGWGDPYRMEIACLLFGWYSGIHQTKYRSIVNGRSMIHEGKLSESGLRRRF